MKKLYVSALLFPTLLAVTVSVGSQTRPRRVTQPVTSEASNSNTAQERRRENRAATPDFREGRRPSRWAGILLNTGLSIGSRVGRGDSCGPSRGSILNGPRFASIFSNR